MGVDPVSASLIGGGLSLAGGIFGGGGGSSGTGTSVPYYIPTGLHGADKSYQDSLKQLAGNNPYKTANPQYQQVEQQIINNPYAGGAQTAANTGGAMASGFGHDLAGLSKLYSGEATGLAPYMQQILQMGADPQNALYGRMQQQVNDRANVTNAQYGLTGQQAAGNVQQAEGNFNIDWQNNQLARALQGISGAQQVAGTQAGLGQSAGQTGTGALDFTGQGGQLPYGQYNANLGNQLQALSGGAQFGSQINQLPMQVMQSIIPYLNYGSGATNAATGAAGANQQANYLAGQGIGGLVSNVGSGLANIFGAAGAQPFSSFFNSGSNAPSNSAAYGPFQQSSSWW